MKYEECLELIFNSLPIYQRQGGANYKIDLSKTFKIDNYFGHPHKQFESVHIAGTNGKGSVSHIIAAVLQNNGYKTGLYTSPHLKDFRERIKINGIMIPEDYVLSFITENLDFFKQIQASFFEMTVAMAFKYFRDNNIDIAVVETGMGGRLDSTNIVNPLISVITNIGFDHTSFLGNTLEKITLEKAGIIKKNTPVVLAKNKKTVKNIVSEKAAEMNSELILSDESVEIEQNILGEKADYISKSQLSNYNFRSKLSGLYQKENYQTAIAVLDNLSKKISFNFEKTNDALSNAAEITGIKGRWQKLQSNPAVYCDIAHNEEGLKHVIKQLKSKTYKKLRIILSMVDDKDIDKILPLFPDDAVYYFTQSGIQRALDVKILSEKAKNHNLKGNNFNTVKEALEKAKDESETEDLIFVGGSTFTVAEVV